MVSDSRNFSQSCEMLTKSTFIDHDQCLWLLQRQYPLH